MTTASLSLAAFVLLAYGFGEEVVAADGYGALIAVAGILVLLRYGPRDLAPVARHTDLDDVTVARTTERAS